MDLFRLYCLWPRSCQPT